MKKSYTIIALIVFVFSSWSQEYRDMIIAGTYPVQEIQASAEAYFDVVGRERGKGFNPYKRWEYQALQDMDENGMLKSPEFYYNELENYNNYINQNSNTFSRTTVGAWEELGPTSFNATSSWSPGVGRITSIAVDPLDVNHIIVGGQTGGVWRTISGGLNWIVLTDDLSNIVVYSLVMDPNNDIATNPNTLTYFWGSSSGTIFKSTDSGATWNFLADTGGGNVNKILIDPTDTSKMYCSVEGGGIYKSTNSGLNWTRINNAATTGYDVEFKPGDTNVIYASSTTFFRSDDGGATFTESNIFFSTGPKMIGVSADDPTVVYVLESSNGAFNAIYKSTTSGLIFSELSHPNKNYFNFSNTADGSNGGGQAPRDMDITVNPADADEVHIAGGNTWRSINGGTSFNITSQWVPGNASGLNIGYCHADVDILEYVNGELYVGTDGGIFVAKTPSIINSTYYSDLTPGLGIRQFYKIGISQTDPVVVTGGSQDNGSSVRDVNGNWTDWLGADGMEGFIDKNDSNIMYGTSQFGNFYRTINGGLNLTGISQPDGKGGSSPWNWITPFEQDPIDQNVIYSAFDIVYKSVNSGSTWTAISPVSGIIDQLKIAPSNNDIIYIAINNTFLATLDGGVNWFQSPSYSGGNINAIAIHPTDPAKIAIATADSEKVYVSTNSGISWTSYKNDLPAFSSRAVAWDDNADNGLYVGMNFGVYYIDDTSNNLWQPFSNGLSNVSISELEINYVENKIYAGTYGRGLWRSELFNTLGVNDFEFDNISLYPNSAKKDVFLSWNKPDDVSIRIYNTTGKLMYFAKNKNLIDPLKIDVSNYSSGLYFVKINNINGEIIKKLIVE